VALVSATCLHAVSLPRGPGGGYTRNPAPWSAGQPPFPDKLDAVS